MLFWNFMSWYNIECPAADDDINRKALRCLTFTRRTQNILYYQDKHDLILYGTGVRTLHPFVAYRISSNVAARYLVTLLNKILSKVSFQE